MFHEFSACESHINSCLTFRIAEHVHSLIVCGRVVPLFHYTFASLLLDGRLVILAISGILSLAALQMLRSQIAARELRRELQTQFMMILICLWASLKPNIITLMMIIHGKHKSSNGLF